MGCWKKATFGSAGSTASWVRICLALFIAESVRRIGRVTDDFDLGIRTGIEPIHSKPTGSGCSERDHDIIRLSLRTYELLVSRESKAQDAQNLFGFLQSAR